MTYNSVFEHKVLKQCVYVCLYLLAAMLPFGCQKDETPIPNPEKGYVDLSNWNFEKNGVVSLKGNWVLSGDNQQNLQKTDIAEYKLKIKLPETPDILAVKLESNFFSFSLRQDGQLLTENGIGPNNKFDFNPLNSGKTIRFKNDREITQLTVRVSIHQLKDSTIWNEFYLGTDKQIEKKEKGKLIVDVFLFGTILMMALYHFTLFALRRDNKSLLYFGIFCLLITTRPIYCNDTLFSFILSGLPASAIFRWIHIIFYLNIVCIGLFYINLFPSDFGKKFLYVIKIMGLFFVLASFFQPIGTLMMASRVYQLITICYSLVLFYQHYKAMVRKEEGSLLFAMGFLVLIFAFINDSLFSVRIIHTLELANWSVLFFILMQSFLLSKQFSSNFYAVKVLTRELKDKNAALENLDKLKDEFLANTSHELRTPLNGIIGITDSLIKGVAGKLSQTAIGNLSMVVSSAKRLSGLINDILDYSKLENKDLVLHKKAVDIRSVAETVLMVSRQLILGKELLIVNEIPKNLNCVDGDENRLQQILYNLVGNAIKFTNQGRITVSAKQNIDHMELAVSDTGPGIPESSFKLIFQSFKQHQQPESRTSEGTGLGLSITKKLVKLHNGKIWVESKPGQGSTFFFTLPLADTKADAERSPQHEETKEIPNSHSKSVNQPVYSKPDFGADYMEQTGKVQVLVVDDEPVNLHVVANFLVLEKISFNLIVSGKELIERINCGPKPDVVLLDIMMPEMTGYEVCQLLREKYSSSELPIIMMTAKNRVSDLVEGFESGANDYLTKPFAKDELLARIKSQLIIKKAYETLEENLQLKKELKEKKQNEQHLLMIQKKLSDMLNTVPDPMIAINEEHKISFLNQSFLDLSEFSLENFLGKRYLTLFSKKNNESLQELTNDLLENNLIPGKNKSYHQLLFCISNGKEIKVDVLITPLELEDELLFVMILRQESKQAVNESSVALLQNSLAIINELNQNKTRIQTLEESLIGLTAQTLEEHPEWLKDLKDIDRTLEKIGGVEREDDQSSIRKNVVIIMKQAIAYWIESTGTSKLDLAKSSKLWKIHSDANGWERARTLDKYLDIKTCPQNPRLEQVINTAYFVLANCNPQSPQKKLLEEQLSKLTKTIN